MRAWRVEIFELSQLLTQSRSQKAGYLEFLRRPSLSVGLYRLPAGGTDPQHPHREDEVYYVIQGRAKFKAGNQERAVQAGSIIFVAAGVEHRFHSIEEDLEVLVFFAPAESKPATGSEG